jgi:hypothetical protein
VRCYFHAFGNLIEGNVMRDNGTFGNVTNGDLANAALPFAANNCFRANVDFKTGAPSAAPAGLPSRCGHPWNPNTAQEVALIEQVICDAQGPATGLCSGPGYPHRTKPRLLPIPRQVTMPDPCAGVPANNWCGGAG